MGRPVKINYSAEFAHGYLKCISRVRHSREIIYPANPAHEVKVRYQSNSMSTQTKQSEKNIMPAVNYFHQDISCC